jgi:hypothetical protein
MRLISVNLRPTYRCVLKKDIIIPRKDIQGLALAIIDGTYNLTKSVDLPFPPQIGMSLSDFTQLDILSPSDKSYVDGTRFDSGRIENINWNHNWKQFECTVGAHELPDIEELGVTLIKHIVGGWKLEQERDPTADNAIDAFLARWRQEIEHIEREKQQSLDIDRRELDRAHKILDLARKSG